MHLVEFVLQVLLHQLSSGLITLLTLQNSMVQQMLKLHRPKALLSL